MREILCFLRWDDIGVVYDFFYQSLHLFFYRVLKKTNSEDQVVLELQVYLFFVDRLYQDLLLFFIYHSLQYKVIEHFNKREGVDDDHKYLNIGACVKLRVLLAHYGYFLFDHVVCFFDELGKILKVFFYLFAIIEERLECFLLILFYDYISPPRINFFQLALKLLNNENDFVTHLG